MNCVLYVGKRNGLTPRFVHIVVIMVANKNKKESKREIRAWLNGLKHAQGCVTCPERNPSLLTFHHINPEDKFMNIATMVWKGYGRKRIGEELEKCVVMCERCQKGIHEPNRLVQLIYSNA